MNGIKHLLRSKIISGTTFFVSSIMAANILNFLFNAYLGRNLSLGQFGLVTFINTVTYVLNIVLSAVSASVIHKIAYIAAQQGPKEATLEYKKIQRSILWKAIIGTGVFILLSPFMTKIFHIHTVTTLLWMSPAIIASTLGVMNRAYLQARLLFFFVGLIAILEPLFKLILAVLLVQLKQLDNVYLSIPFSGLAAALAAIFIVRFITRAMKFDKEELQGRAKFPKTFFTAALITGLANNLFLTFDVLLVKHFFSPHHAGVYSLLSLVGKMIYFFGSILTTFMLPFVSADLGAKRNPAKTFNRLFLLTLVTVMAFVSGMIFLGPQFLPMAFGAKVREIFPFIPFYSIAIGAYTVASSILVYHLARKHYTFSIVSFIISFLLCAGIILFHDNINEVVTVIMYLSILNLVALGGLHVFHTWGVMMSRFLIDFVCLFLPIPIHEPEKKGKRILIFNWRDTKHSYAGGAEVYVHELARRWVKMGNTVTMFCGNDEQCHRYDKIDGINIIRRGGFYVVYIWAFLYYLLRLRGKYDVVVDCQNGIPFFTPLFAKEKVYCVMFHVHQKVFRESLIWPLAMIASYLEANIMPWAYRHIEFITISQSTKKDMEKIGLGKAGIHVIHPGVDTTQLIPGEKDKKPTALYVGRLKKYKSVDVFLKTIPLILKKIKNARFIVAGDGEERRNLKALARRLEIFNKVEFVGKITEEVKKELYQKAWVFANPSMMEGWAITNVEASACGTPVVAANVPGMRDSVKNEVTGFLVPYGDEELMAEKICELMKDDRLRKTMGEESTKWAKRFEWDKSARKGLDILNNKR